MNVQMQVTHVSPYYANKRCKDPRHAEVVGHYDYVDERVHSAMDFTRWEPITITVPAQTLTLRPCEAGQ